MASPAAVIAQLLVNAGVGARPPASGSVVNTVWRVYIDNMPDGTTAPDNAIVCSNSGGMRDGRSHTTGKTLIHPGVQVRIRGGVGADLWEKVAAISALLDNAVGETVVVNAETWLISSIRQEPPVNMGAEPGNRPRRHYAINTMVSLREV